MMGLTGDALRRNQGRLLSDQLKDRMVDEHISVIVQANLEQLARLDPLKRIQASLANLVGLAVDMGAPEEHRTEAIASLRRLLGDEGGLSSLLNSIIKLTESLQTQERKALGIDDRARRVEVSGPGGGAIRVGDAGAALRSDAPDLSKLPTEELTALLTAANILDGARGRPPIPLPPGHSGTGAIGDEKR
jgi:hypothetical protein